MKIKRRYVSLGLFLVVSLLYFGIISPHRNSIHEHGHLYAMEAVFPGHECEIHNSAEMWDPVLGIRGTGSFTICPTVSRREASWRQQFISMTSGFGFEFLMAFLVLVSPFAFVGGIWMLGIARSLIFLSHVHQADFGWMPYWAKVVISVMLVLLFLISILIQHYYIRRLVFGR